MPRPCSICSHPQHAEIDALLTKGVAFRAVAATFGLTKSSVSRHRKHCTSRALVIYVPPPVPQTAPGAVTVVTPSSTLPDLSSGLRSLLAQAMAHQPSDEEALALASTLAAQAGAIAYEHRDDRGMTRASAQLLRVDAYKLETRERRARLANAERVDPTLKMLSDVMNDVLTPGSPQGNTLVVDGTSIEGEPDARLTNHIARG